MVKLSRVPTPDCLKSGTAKWTEEYLRAREKNPRHRFRWRKEKTCYPEIRQKLMQMTGERCSYCDGFLNRESRGTVDHFRPKETFPELAFDWYNLLAACDLCQSHKLSKFDELLLKPDEQDYSFTRYYVLNYSSGAVEPAPFASAEDQARASTTLEMLGINTEPRKRARLEQPAHFSRDKEANLDDYCYRYFLS